MTTLVTLIKKASSPDQKALIRASIPLLYAHWEGFGKTCITRYLEFVSYRRLKYRNLKPAFVFLSSLGLLGEMARSSYKDSIPIMNSILKRADETNKDTFRKKISTKSNLRYEVLVDLLCLCGLDHSSFAGQKDFIDSEICDSRNEIAHGVGGAPLLDTFLKRRDAAFDLMKNLENLVVNGAMNEAYKA
jgi:hypothetical protein